MIAGCSAAPREAPVARMAPPEHPPAVSAARKLAAEQFYQGKSLALAGESDCAGEAFRDALETFRIAAREGNPSDLAFASELYDSIDLYRPAIEAGARAAEAERPPAEDPRDSLVATAPLPSPDEIEKAKSEVGSAASDIGFDIPIVVNDAVLRAVAFYQFRTPMAFAAALKRKGRYLDLMRGILKEEGVPQDLVYVAMVESAFKYQAHSRAAAHGFWQFIAGTGKRYGLKRNRSLDERSDPVKSTRAAAAYFRDLYEMFGDWHLAMAAYDAGEGRILKSLQRTGARDFWELAAGSSLRRETRDYVPFVLAAALIAKDPARFGFDVVPDPPLAWDTVTVHKPVDLARVAELTQATLPDLQLLNSELRTRTTPHGVPAYGVRVPAGSAALLASRIAALPAAPARRRETCRRPEGRDAPEDREARGRFRGRALRLERPAPHGPPEEGHGSRRAGQARERPAARSARLGVPRAPGRDPRRPDARGGDHARSDVGPVHRAAPAHGARRQDRAALPARVDIPVGGLRQTPTPPRESQRRKRAGHATSATPSSPATRSSRSPRATVRRRRDPPREPHSALRSRSARARRSTLSLAA